MAAPLNKDWMRETDIFGDVYRKGVREFLKFAADNGDSLTCPCPCRHCLNGKRHPMSVVKIHLYEKGIYRNYTTWYLHGENLVGESSRSRPAEVVHDENSGFNLNGFLDSFFGVHSEDPYEEVPPEEQEPDVEKRHDKYRKLSESHLHPACEGVNTLSAIVELYNLKKTYKMSGHCVDSLLVLLRKWLPRNNFPKNYDATKAILKDLGMEVKSIHACPNHCTLYYKELAGKPDCDVCKVSRYMRKQGKFGLKMTKEPCLVLRYFPLGPRLAKLFSIPWIAAFMDWHKRADSDSSGFMRHPMDSPQWQRFQKKFPDFAKEGRNVYLGISTDGFNPHGVQTLSWSCWPVILVVYNLPPSLCMKSEFQIMSMLIPGRKSPGHDIDVFMRVLVDELQDLWKNGIRVWDSYRKEHFTLKATLMFGIHDLPALGVLSGCTTHGYSACVVCADSTRGAYLPYAKKVVYPNYRIFLKDAHSFRNGKFLGLDRVESKKAAKRLTGEQSLELLKDVHYIPGKTQIRKQGKRRRYRSSDDDTDESSDDERNVGVETDSSGQLLTGAFYKKCCFWELESYRSLDVRHCVDMMHTEKNVMEHIYNVIFDVKSKAKLAWEHRDTLKKKKLGCGMWKEKRVKKKACMVPMFVLSPEEKNIFCNTLKDLKFPSGFCSNMSNNVIMDKLSLMSLKSHDYHILMGYLLPVLLQHAFPGQKHLRIALQQVSLYFRLLCSKVVKRDDLINAKSMIAEAMCVLEKYFPPSFFDISVHNMVHLADEALFCGPVRYRWMYPFERAMKECKNIPNNKRFIEASISNAQILSESVRYAMEHSANAAEAGHKANWNAFLDVGSEFTDVGSVLGDKRVDLSPQQWVQIRRWILFQRDDIPGFDDYYRDYCASHSDAGVDEVVFKTEFLSWLYEKVTSEEKTDTLLWRYLKGPEEVREYKKYRVNGFVFCSQASEENLVTQNSGVTLLASTTFRSSKKDKHPKTQETRWYGMIKQILYLDYGTVHETVFYCNWVKVESGVQMCKDSDYPVVNLKRLKSASEFLDEPVILAEEASQVFYSRDMKNQDWWVPIHPPRGLTAEVDSVEVPSQGSFHDILYEEPHLRELMKYWRKPNNLKNC